jgi:electron transfer flavoprotein beta subunit
MKIIVCLKEVIDTSLDLGYGQVGEALLQKGMSFRLNPNDLQALAEALRVKENNSNTEITLLALGAERVESYLREGIALGADKAIRIWEENFRYLSTYQKSRILSVAISLLDAELVLVGNKSLDNASGLTGPLLGAWLNMPCVCEVTGFNLQNETKAAVVSRQIGKGLKENLLVILPAVLAIANSTANLLYAGLERILNSQEAAVTHFTLSDLGISPLTLKKDQTRIAELSFPRPRPKAAPLDSSLPAFYRILALLQGSISKRRGEILRGNTDELVDQLFDLLVKEEVIKPAAEL